MRISNFKPILFFYEWQIVIKSDVFSEPELRAGSGIVRAAIEEHLAPHNLIGFIKDDLLTQGWRTEGINDGRLLNIRKID